MYFCNIIGFTRTIQVKIVIILVFISSGCNRKREAEQQFAITLPKVIELGSVKPAENKTINITIKNISNNPVVIASCRTSCECIKVLTIPKKLQPDESSLLPINYAPDSEPSFSGELSVELLGLDESDKVLFSTHVNISIH